MYINNVLYCFYSSDTEALEACFRLLHDDDDDDDVMQVYCDKTAANRIMQFSHCKAANGLNC